MANPLLVARINAARTIDLERYAEEGADSRFDYLLGLAEANDLPLQGVIEVADLMGPDEDFDGLVIAIEDQADMIVEAFGEAA